MHYSDNSHRWVAPPNVEQSVWEADVRAHLEHHLLTMGGPVEPGDPRQCRLILTPKPRTSAPADTRPPTPRAFVGFRAR